MIRKGKTFLGQIVKIGTGPTYALCCVLFLEENRLFSPDMIGLLGGPLKALFMSDPAEISEAP
jgi:hypothetical protein